MGYKFWIKRGLCLFVVILNVLFIIELLKQHSIEESIIFAITWSFLGTSVFIGTRLYYSRKGIECVLCNDIPSRKVK